MVKNNTIISRILIIVFSVIMGITMVSSSSFATTNDQPESTNLKSIQWEYQIIDENGNVEESGYMPNPMLKYSWSGVTLKNGKTAIFKPAGEKGLYAAKGTSIKVTWRLNRSAKHRAYTDGYSHNFSSGNGFKVEQTATSGSKTFKSIYSDYFYGSITNLSSDSITVKSFSITF